MPAMKLCYHTGAFLHKKRLSKELKVAFMFILWDIISDTVIITYGYYTNTFTMSFLIKPSPIAGA